MGNRETRGKRVEWKKAEQEMNDNQLGKASEEIEQKEERCPDISSS